jgi:F420-dependent hydroxymycolic acid dehydrogenase
MAGQSGPLGPGLGDARSACRADSLHPIRHGSQVPNIRYRPAIVAQAFASLAAFAPGRVFLGLGSGEALNEVPAGGGWDSPAGRIDRMLEAAVLIRQLWTGEWTTHNGRYYQVQNARMYDPPPQPVPIYVAASGTRAARAAGELGDGWSTVGDGVHAEDSRKAFRKGAESAGKNPDQLRVLVESFVVVGSTSEAEEAARLWRFSPLGFAQLLDDPDPRHIQHRAEQQVKLQDVYARWTVGEDPNAHVRTIEKLAAAGTTDVFIHTGQSDQPHVIDFYGREVLPRIRELRRAA